MARWLFRTWNWVRRFPYRKGYGVHSPTDFFFITSVIYEQKAYYAYQTLKGRQYDEKRKSLYREKVNKLLLRVVNHRQPKHIVDIGLTPDLHTAYLHAGKKTAPLYGFYESAHIAPFSIAEEQGLQMFPYNSFHKFMTETSAMECIHISHPMYYASIVEQCLSCATSQTCIIIAYPYANKEKKKWWKQVLEDERVRVSYDLYDIGILCCDHKRIKKHYKVNFF